MTFFSKFFKRKNVLNANEFFEVIGKELEDISMQNFISNHKISRINPTNLDGRTIFKNEYISFQYHHNSTSSTITTITINPTKNTTLPFGLELTDSFVELKEKMGEPELIYYHTNFVSFHSYSSEIYIDFEHPVDSEKNKIVSVTFKKHPKIKYTNDQLAQIKLDYYNDWHKQDKTFGQSSNWIAIKTDSIAPVLSFFNSYELIETKWSVAKMGTKLGSTSFFITPVINDWVFILSWSLTHLTPNAEDNVLINLSKKFGDVFAFDNNYHYSMFLWGHFSYGEIIRFYHEEELNVISDIGDQTEIEIKLDIFNKKKEYSEMEEEYFSDQDYQRNYRTFMNKTVLDIATEWSINPKLNNEVQNVPEHVYFYEDKNL